MVSGVKLSANQYSYVKGHRGILNRVSWLVVLNTQPTSTVMSKVIEAYYTGLVGLVVLNTGLVG